MANVVNLKKTDDYDSLVHEGREVLEKQENLNWLLGELAAKVENKYGEGRLQQYADDIDMDYTTLRDYRYTVKCWPQSVGRPTFLAVARALASQPDRYEIVAKNPKITVRQARKLVQDRDPEKIENLKELIRHNCYAARELSLADCGGNHYDCSILKGHVTQELIDGTQEAIDTWTKLRDHLVSLQ